MAGAPLYRWTLDEVLRAADAGALSGPFEFLDGRLWSIPIGSWQEETAARISAALRDLGTKQAGPLLAGGETLLLPDVWISHPDAAPVARLRADLAEWRPADVLLVVEVSEETTELDLTTKARLYAAAGYENYWVVVPHGIFVHSDPLPADYRLRVLLGREDRVAVPHAADLSLRVDDLVASHTDR